MKIYNNFNDKFGNNYNFCNYLDFAKFWFNIPRKASLIYFPDNFKRLNNAALNSKESKIKTSCTN